MSDHDTTAVRKHVYKLVKELRGDNMPFYDYQCPNCGHEFEELRKYEDIPNCPKCGSHTQRKQIYATVSTGLPNGHCS